MRTYLSIIALSAIALSAVGLATAGGAIAAKGSVSTVSAKLTSAAEVPKTKGGGSGTATITFDTKKGQICWKVSLSGVDKPLSVYVHLGAPGHAGPGVIALGSGYQPKGCEIARLSTLTPVVKNPTKYYVNVHTRTHLNGAVRGQLKAG